MGFHLKLPHSKAKDGRKPRPSHTLTPLATRTTTTATINTPTPTRIPLTTRTRRSATARLPSTPSPRLPCTELRTPPPRYAILNSDDRLPRHPQPTNGRLAHAPPIRPSPANLLPTSWQREAEAHREAPTLRRYRPTAAVRPTPPPPPYQPYQPHDPSTHRLVLAYRDPHEVRRRGAPMSLLVPSRGTPGENARRLDQVREEQARPRRRQSMPIPMAIPASAVPERGAWSTCRYCQRRIDEPIAPTT